MAKEPFKPQLRLVFQGTIPVPDTTTAEALYEHLKQLLLETHKDITLSGQIMKMLEPCCGDRKKQKPHEKSP